MVVRPLDLDPGGTLFGPPEAGTTLSLERLYDVMPGPEALQALGATGLIAAGVITIARGVTSPSSSMLFTNVRLAPCFVSATVHQSGAAAISTGARVGERVKSLAPSGGLSGIGAIVEPIRDGFDSALGNRLPLDDSEGRGRLMAQIGVVLGTIYLAFLTVWFWLTRVRWNGGWREGI